MKINKKIKLGLIGATIGFIVGFIIFLIGFNLTFDEWYFASIGFPFGIGDYFGSFLGFEDYSRIIPYFLGGMLIYTWLGVLMGILVNNYLIKDDKNVKHSKK